MPLYLPIFLKIMLAKLVHPQLEDNIDKIDYRGRFSTGVVSHSRCKSKCNHENSYYVQADAHAIYGA